MTPAGIIDGPGRINIYDNRGDESIGELESYTRRLRLRSQRQLDPELRLPAGRIDGRDRHSQRAAHRQVLPRDGRRAASHDAQIVCNIAVRNPTPAELMTTCIRPDGPVLLPSPLDPFGVPADSPIGPLNPQECVPFNPFGLGNANQAAKDWIVDPEKKQFRVLNQDFAEVLATGVVSEGWGAGPLSLAAGLTWRDEEFTQDNYPAYGERGVLNAPALGIRGIPAGFAERRQPLAAPVLRDRRRQRREERLGVVQRAQHADLAVRLRAARGLDVRAIAARTTSCPGARTAGRSGSTRTS